MSTLSPQAQQTLQAFSTNLPYFARACLKLVSSSAEMMPMVFNPAQELLHRRIEQHRLSRGKVRINIVKGRQQGCSTYVAARFLHRSLFSANTTTMILAHQFKSTQQLYRMVSTFYDNLPDPIKSLYPTASRNASEMEFASNSSRYITATAGSDSIGRGFTCQCLHASEAAFWEHADEITTGLFRTVPNNPSSEIIIESTANGVNNFFHNQCLAGLDSDSQYETIFIPWYLQPEYRMPLPSSSAFVLSDEEHQMKKTYSLDDQQVYWYRRLLLDEYHGERWKMRQEYPLSLNDAFVHSGESFFDLVSIERAVRKDSSQALSPVRSAPIILGVDPARSRDRSAFCLRRGKDVLWLRSYRDLDTQQLTNIIDRIIRTEDVDKVFVDTAYGHAPVDLLKQDYNHASKVRAVHFGERSLYPDMYANKRSEMLHEAKKFFEEPEASIPQDEEFTQELLAVPNPRQTTTKGVWIFPDKSTIKSSLKGASPDLLDAFILTFAYPVPNKILPQSLYPFIHLDSQTTRGHGIKSYTNKTLATFGNQRKRT